MIPALLTESGLANDVIDLAGTYTVTGGTVQFQMQGDSFVPSTTWTIGTNSLRTTLNQTQGTAQITLTRQ